MHRKEMKHSNSGRGLHLRCRDVETLLNLYLNIYIYIYIKKLNKLKNSFKHVLKKFGAKFQNPPSPCRDITDNKRSKFVLLLNSPVISHYLAVLS